jgi:hypothetical protein
MNVSEYDVSVGSGLCFPQVIDINLRPTGQRVAVKAQENWHVRRRLSAHISTVELADFAREVITRTASATDLVFKDPATAGFDPWTDYDLPDADGTLVTHEGAFSPSLADWLSAWLETLASAPQTRVWIPKPWPSSWLGRRIALWTRWSDWMRVAR